MKALRFSCAIVAAVFWLSAGADLKISEAAAQGVWIKNPEGTCSVWSLNPARLGWTWTWSGECVDGKATGNGILTWKDRSKIVETYNGDLVAGKREGKGTYKWRDGRSYAGNWVNDKRRGRGLQKWPNGRSYDGDWVDGVMHGQGTFKFTDGNTYTGDFKNDIRDGEGTLTTPEGHVYTGGFKANKANGTGKITFVNGDSFEGKFVDGKRTDGVYTWKSGYSIKMKNGKQVGKRYRKRNKSGDSGSKKKKTGASTDGENT